jgi:SulP family sulfate permease
MLVPISSWVTFSAHMTYCSAAFFLEPQQLLSIPSRTRGNRTLKITANNVLFQKKKQQHEHHSNLLPDVSTSAVSSPTTTTLFLSGGAGHPSRDFQSRLHTTPPPSQIESITQNAKSLNPFGSHLERETIVSSLASGLAVSLAMVPEAISFAFVAGVSPLVGLWTTVFLGFLAAAFGGRAGICSSASGACSIVVASLCASHGPAYLSACAIMAGILQMVFGGYVGVGKWIRLVPHPVMLGFVNGLTIVMFRAQLMHFQTSTGSFLSLSSAAGKSMYGMTALTMLLVKTIPKIKQLRVVPPSLGAVTFCAILAKVLKIPVKTLSDVSGAETFRGGLSVLPTISLPKVPFSVESLNIIAPYAITMAAVGAIESLLTMQLLDGIADDGKRGSTRKECFAQGLGNLASGFAGGIGGCALLGQSIINAESGGLKSRLSGMSMAVFLALGIVVGAPLLASVPVAALVGVMFTVCVSTFSWSSLRILNKIPRLDAAIILLVSAITVKDDLAKAVVAGVVVSALGFAWKQSTSISARESFVKVASQKKEWKTYNLDGPLFFGSTTQFSTLFDVKNDPDDIIIDFTNSRVYDHSALEAINNIAEKYGEMGKKVHLRHLSNDCGNLLKLLNGGDRPYELIESDPKTDPVYGVAF